jgi:hypothetical protein
MAASQSTQEKTIMKKQTLQLASLCLLLMFAATVAQAQAKITVKVPFNFWISDRTLPAGQYSVSSSSGLLTVQDSSGKPIFIGFVYTVGGRRAGATGQIVFHCYDEHCFLSEFWTSTQNGSQLLPSRYEAELAKHRKGAEFALLEHPQKR